jgi:uncharacterized protein (TIGR00251 family)
VTSSAVTVEERDGITRFTVHVQPRASRTGISGAHDGALRVRLQAPPVDGAANEALVAFLAEALGVPRRLVRITGGASSRRKTVEVDGARRRDVLRLLSSS